MWPQLYNQQFKCIILPNNTEILFLPTADTFKVSENSIMELRHLHYFLAVAEELNFRKAAERLYISQPPLSRQIKDLEDEVGALLFRRTKKQVELTEAGEFLKKEAEEIFNRLESAKLIIKQLDALGKGLVRIGYMSSLSYEILSKAIKQMKEKHPNVVTKLYEIPTVKQINALENYKLDVGIIRAPLKTDKLTPVRLFRERFIFAYPKAWEDRIKVKEGIIAFSKEPFVFFNKEYAPEFRSFLLEICNRIGFSPNIEHESNNIHSILSLVEQEMGVTIIPESIKQAYNGNLVSFIHVPSYSPTTEIFAVSLRQKENQYVDDFITILQSLYKK